MILKFHLPERADFDMSLPEDCEILDVQFQRGVPTMWVQCKSTETNMKTRFHWVPTNANENSPPKEWSYVKTLQFSAGLVFHLYVGA